MEIPSNWELFKIIQIGTAAGVMASTIQNRGPLYVFIMSLMFWAFLVISLPIASVGFKWIQGKEEEEETEDRPHKDVNYAS